MGNSTWGCRRVGHYLETKQEQKSIVFDEHLGCLHVLAVVKSAIMNIRMHVSFDLWFPLGIPPEVGLQDHMLTLFLVF